MAAIRKNTKTVVNVDGKCRLNLAISESVRERMEALKDSTDADSLTEVIRRALAAYEYIKEQQRQGNRIMLERNGEIKEVHLL